MANSGTRGSITYHMLRLAFRVIIFMAIVSLGGLYYLFKRTDQNAFRTNLREAISESIGASELAMRGAKRSQWNLEISRLASEGGPDTFFEFIEIRNFRCRMGLIDGLVGIWNLGPVGIHRLDIQLRAGTDSPEDSANIGKIIFREFERVKLEDIAVANANISWGYSERTRGRVDNTSAKIQRDDKGWRITLRGGQFHQNWLRDLEVVEIIALCSPEGILFEKAELRQGQGSVDFSGLRVSAGDRPRLRGTAKVQGLELEYMLPAAANNFVEGRISSDFAVSGSTNSADGIAFDGTIVMDGANMVTLRDQVHLLRALSVVDFHNNYRRLDFNEGSFRLTTNAGQMLVRDINLVAEDLATLSGAFKARPPTSEELDVMLAREGVSRGIGSARAIEDSDEKFLLNVEELERQFTLRQAANAARRAQEGEGADDSGQIFDRIGMNYEARMLAEQQAVRLSRMLVYEGGVGITLRPNAFDRTETLMSRFPPNPETGRIHFNVPLSGPLHELTLPEAETIYELGRR